MTAAAAIIRSALGLLRVVDANEAPEAEDFADGLRALNAMISPTAADAAHPPLPIFDECA